MTTIFRNISCSSGTYVPLQFRSHLKVEGNVEKVEPFHLEIHPDRGLVVGIEHIVTESA